MMLCTAEEVPLKDLKCPGGELIDLCRCCVLCSHSSFIQKMVLAYEFILKVKCTVIFRLYFSYLSLKITQLTPHFCSLGIVYTI